MKYVHKIIRCIEVALALFVIVGVVFSGVMLIVHSHSLILLDTNNFQQFMDQALLYIIGLEFAIMILRRDPKLVLELLIFAIARKMIVGMDNGVDFFMGSLAIFLLYAARMALTKMQIGHILE